MEELFNFVKGVFSSTDQTDTESLMDYFKNFFLKVKDSNIHLKLAAELSNNLFNYNVLRKLLFFDIGIDGDRTLVFHQIRLANIEKIKYIFHIIDSIILCVSDDDNKCYVAAEYFVVFTYSFIFNWIYDSVRIINECITNYTNENIKKDYSELVEYISQFTHGSDGWLELCETSGKLKKTPSGSERRKLTALKLILFKSKKFNILSRELTNLTKAFETSEDVNDFEEITIDPIQHDNLSTSSEIQLGSQDVYHQDNIEPVKIKLRKDRKLFDHTNTLIENKKNFFEFSSEFILLELNLTRHLKIGFVKGFSLDNEDSLIKKIRQVPDIRLKFVCNIDYNHTFKGQNGTEVYKDHIYVITNNSKREVKDLDISINPKNFMNDPLMACLFERDGEWWARFEVMCKPFSFTSCSCHVALENFDTKHSADFRDYYELDGSSHLENLVLPNLPHNSDFRPAKLLETNFFKRTGSYEDNNIYDYSIRNQDDPYSAVVSLLGRVVNK